MDTENSGVLIVNKHPGVTSHDVVGKIRRLYGTRRVGHAGTLDPMATGVLVILIGRAAKASEYLAHDSKHYRALLRLGVTTDTEDTTGEILSQTDLLPTQKELEAILPRFCGEILQTPPMYSALKVNGKKLVDLAREGKTVERAPRPVSIFSLQAFPTQSAAEYVLELHCSGGTYVRTLCADIGAALGCGGAMAALERIEACGFSINDAHSLADLERLSPSERNALLLSTESLFANCPTLPLPAFYEKLCRSGCEIYLKKLGCSLPVGTRVRLCNERGAFFALGEVGEYENGIAAKAIKTFAL